MTDNHNFNGELDERIERALADAEAGGTSQEDTLIDALAQSQPIARSSFQTDLEAKLLAQLEQTPTAITAKTEEKLIPMTSKKRKNNTFHFRRSNWRILAAITTLFIIAGAAIAFLNTSCLFGNCEPPAFDPLSNGGFEMTATVLVERATQTAAAPLLLTEQANAAAQRDENCATVLGWEGRHTVVSGETIFSIAEIYDTTIEDIVRENCLIATELIIGDALRVPFVDPSTLQARTQEAVIEQLRLTETALSATPVPVVDDPFLTATAFVGDVTQTAEFNQPSDLDPFRLTATAIVEQATREAGR